MATIRNVAQRAQVSVGTVSRVLNRNATVHPAVRRAVEDAIKELGYRPHPLARSLRNARTQTLGLMVGDLQNPVTIDLLRGLEEAADEAGYTLLVAESREDFALETKRLQSMLDKRVDGLLCAPIQSATAVAEAARTAGVPLVLVNQRSPRAGIPTAYIDESAAIRDALDLLVGLGHRRIGLAHGRGAAGRQRRRFIDAELVSRGVDPAAGSHVMFTDFADCRREMARLFDSPQQPTAVLVGTHGYVPGVLIAARAAGLSIPDDLSLVGFGDSEWARAFSPPLATITSDQHRHARAAVRLLLALIDGVVTSPPTPSEDSQFIPRGSCAAPPKGDGP